MHDLVKFQFSSLSVFEPFLGRLITTNVEIPGGTWYICKILVAVDIDIDELSSFGRAWGGNDLFDQVVAVNRILCDVIF